MRVVEAVETEYLGKLDVCVPKLSHLNLWFPHFERMRQQQGGELWFYTCCHPVGRYPNRFLDQSLLQTRVLHWINYLYALQGYLHWGLNWYGTDDPYSQEGISKDLPLGDRAILYPGQQGLIGSLRFSANATVSRTSNTSGCSKTGSHHQAADGAGRLLARSAAATAGAVPARHLVIPRLHARSRRAVGDAPCGGGRD